MIAATPPPRFARLRKLTRADSGVAATEFGLISPALFLLLFGAFDVGHTLYLKSVLQGAVDKASRDATLETAAGTSDATRNAIDDMVRAQVLPLKNDAKITFTRRFYRTFSDVKAAKAETFTDSASGVFKNGKCDNNETFVDTNGNGVRDMDGGDSVNRAGARDNVVYTVTVAYTEMFPVHAFITGSSQRTLQATTVLANQPYGDQESYDAAKTGKCP